MNNHISVEDAKQLIADLGYICDWGAELSRPLQRPLKSSFPRSSAASTPPSIEDQKRNALNFGIAIGAVKSKTPKKGVWNELDELIVAHGRHLGQVKIEVRKREALAKYA
jgi:hypothetical protein